MSRSRSAAVAALTALFVAAAVGVTVAKEPAAPATPQVVRAYHDSGQWAKDTKAAFAKATAALKKAVAKKVKRATLVLDIDDTSLSTYDCTNPGDFSAAANAGCIVGAKLPAIPQALTLAKYAVKKKVKLVFITARPQAIETQTRANLALAKFPTYTLVMKPASPTPVTSAAYKTAARKALVAGGAKIVLSVGDQQSDLVGGYAATTVKIPNPMYVNK